MAPNYFNNIFTEFYILYEGTCFKINSNKKIIVKMNIQTYIHILLFYLYTYIIQIILPPTQSQNSNIFFSSIPNSLTCKHIFIISKLSNIFKFKDKKCP